MKIFNQRIGWGGELGTFPSSLALEEKILVYHSQNHSHKHAHSTRLPYQGKKPPT